MQVSSPSSDSLNLELEEIALEHPASVEKKRRLDVPRGGKFGQSPVFNVMSPMSQIADSGKKCKRKNGSGSQQTSFSKGNGSSLAKPLILADFADELLFLNKDLTRPTDLSSTSTSPTSSYQSCNSSLPRSRTRHASRLSKSTNSSSPHSSKTQSTSHSRSSPKFLPRPPASLPSDSLPSRLRKTLPRKATAERSKAGQCQKKNQELEETSAKKKPSSLATSQYSPVCANITIPARANLSRSRLNLSGGMETGHSQTNESNDSLNRSASVLQGIAKSDLADWNLPATPTSTHEQTKQNTSTSNSAFYSIPSFHSSDSVSLSSERPRSSSLPRATTNSSIPSVEKKPPREKVSTEPTLVLSPILNQPNNSLFDGSAAYATPVFSPSSEALPDTLRGRGLPTNQPTNVASPSMLSDISDVSDSDEDDLVSASQEDVSFEWFPIASAVTKCAKPPRQEAPVLTIRMPGSQIAQMVPRNDAVLRVPDIFHTVPDTIHEDKQLEEETPMKSRRSLGSSKHVRELSDDEEMPSEEETPVQVEDVKMQDERAHVPISMPFFPIPTLKLADESHKCLRYQVSVQVRNVSRGKVKPTLRVAVFEVIDRRSLKVTETQCVKYASDVNFTEPIVISHVPGKLLLFRLFDVQKVGRDLVVASAVIPLDRLVGDSPLTTRMSLGNESKDSGPELRLEVLATANILMQQLNWFQDVRIPSAQALERMAQGFVVTLHAAKAKPKKLYMRWKEGPLDGGLYWAQPGSQKANGNLPVREILSVLRGKHTLGFRNESAFRTLEQQCVSVVCPLRTLELSFETRSDCDVVYSGLVALVQRLSPQRRELFLRGRHLPTAHCAVVVFDNSQDQRMKIAETEGQSGANPSFAQSVVLSCSDRGLLLCLYAKESTKSDRLGNLIGSVKINMAELAALDATTSSPSEYSAKRTTGRELSFELVLESNKPAANASMAPLLVVRVAPSLHALTLHQGPMDTEECLELMRKGQQFTKFGYLTGKAASRFVFYEPGELGGTLFWCNGPDKVLDLNHSIRISSIFDVRAGNGSTPTFTKDEARNAREDLSFSILTTSRSVDLETPFTHVRNAFVHGLRHLLSLPADELVHAGESKGTLSKRNFMNTLKTLPKASGARKFSL